MTVVPVLHRCHLPGFWIRFRRGYRSGTVTSCPDCGINYYWSGYGWVPQETVDAAKVSAIRGGDPIMSVVTAYLLSPNERREVADFQKRWLRWEER